jgi:hypothetical protein
MDCPAASRLPSKPNAKKNVNANQGSGEKSHSRGKHCEHQNRSKILTSLIRIQAMPYLPDEGVKFISSWILLPRASSEEDAVLLIVY